ncbi:MAG: DDE-type integrase/transposase/recombinase [Candidatus Nanoarchaeia archaeon]
MQPRKYVKWTPKLRKWIIKQWLAGITPVSEIARNRKISRSSIYELIDRYKKFGWEGLEPRRKGRKKEHINLDFEDFVLREYAVFPMGSPKMYLHLKAKGFGVSQRKLQQIYNKYKLKMNKRKRPSQIKFVKYEWPGSNALWHTDWTECPFTGQQLIAFIDDYSRYIVHAEYYANATTENMILAFKKAMHKHGKPENILADQGTQFHPKGDFWAFCKEQNIHHIQGRINRPQTNGKI